MDTIQALQTIIATTGESNRALSVAMGKSANYLNSAFEQSKRKNGDFYGATLARVADVCGYKLALVPRASLPDDAIVIDPPE